MIAINIFVICALVAVASAQPATTMAEYYVTYNSSIMHVDNFVNANRRHYSANIISYDLQIQTFKDLYLERINTIGIHKDLLIDSLLKNDELWYPLELLSDESKTCVDKYKPIIPPVAAARFNMDKCMSTATSYLSSLISAVTATNTTLNNYYINTFDKTTQSCKKSYPTNATAYSTCAENAVSAANLYTISNQKTFAAQLASAYSTAKAYVKTAMECSFAEQNKTSSSLGEANTLMDKCRQGNDNCNGRTGRFCENVYYVPASMIDPKNDTMKNVFYGADASVQCLLLNVQ